MWLLLVKYKRSCLVGAGIMARPSTWELLQLLSAHAVCMLGFEVATVLAGTSSASAASQLRLYLLLPVRATVNAAAQHVS